MSDTSSPNEPTWIVLVNRLGEHSLWPASLPPPEGWQETGPEGDAARCMAWVDAHWSALRPQRPVATDAAPPP